MHSLHCPTHLTIALVRVSASVGSGSPPDVGAPPESTLGGSGSQDESRRVARVVLSWRSEGRCVDQCVESFDGMQVCRDLGDALLVTEWGGWE